MPGKASRNRNGFMVPIGPEGEDVPLHHLVGLIRDREARTGTPLIIDVDVPLAEHSQRLYATLGVLVRFKEERD